MVHGVEVGGAAAHAEIGTVYRPLDMAAAPRIHAVRGYAVPPSVLYFTMVLYGGVTRNSRKADSHRILL